jgi:hypothetical protein
MSEFLKKWCTDHPILTVIVILALINFIQSLLGPSS